MNVFQKLDSNIQGRDFVVGDIHGHFSALEELLKRVEFDFKKDRLIATGDLINKGPESERVLEFLDQGWFYSVCGNHDKYVSDFIYGDIGEWESKWLYDQDQTWITDKLKSRFAREVAENLSQLPYMIEVENNYTPNNIGVVHAEIPIDMSWGECRQKLLLPNGEGEVVRHGVLNNRERLSREFKQRADQSVAGIGMIYSGHTPFSMPWRQGNVVYIDAERRKGAILTIVELGQRHRVLQARPSRVVS